MWWRTNMASRKGLGKTDLIFVIIVIALVATIGVLAVSTPSGTNSLSVYAEICKSVYGPPPLNYYAGTTCDTSSNPVATPTTFDLVKVTPSQNGNTTTLGEAYFAVFVASGQIIRVTLSAGAPVTYNVYLDNRTGFNTSALADEEAYHSRQLTGDSGTTSVDEYLQNNYFQSGWFVFQVLLSQGFQPFGQAATLTFNIQPGTLQQLEDNSPPAQG
jgi:hypothetical protein